MEVEQNNFSVEEIQESNLKDILVKYLRHWKWFLLSLFVSLALGFVYLRYQTPLYEVNATILIKDDKKGEISSELSAFEDLGILKNNKNIDNEIEVLKSRTLMTMVVKELNLDVSYFSYGRPIEHERYHNTPITLNYTVKNSTPKIKGNWILIPESDKKFVLKDGKNGKTLGTYNFGEAIETAFGKIILTTTPFFADSYLNKDFRVTIKPINEVVDAYLRSVKVTPVNKTSNAIKISLKDAIAAKAADIVNNLIKQHNLDAIADKNQVSRNTADFISDRIKFITDELSLVEGEAQDFKTRYKLTDVESDAKMFVETGSQSEAGVLEINTQMRVAEFMNDYVQKHDKPGDLIPANLGLSDPSLALQITDYNKLVQERSRLLKSSSEKNPVVENLDNQLLALKASIRESLINLKAALQIRVRELSKKENEINSRISSVPKYEREYRIIQRQQQIKEALYLYLLQKREETNIALAVTVANAKVIDPAYSDGEPVSPKQQIIYLAAFVIGLIIPVLVFYVSDMMDTRVHGKKDIDKLKLPYLGDIPLSDSKDRLVVSGNNNSSVAEAFRLLRTNVDFMIGGDKAGSKTVFVTSTIGKEGKSFVALNLAVSLAISGKKTLLVGMDLRAPKILKYLNTADKKGLTDFIMSGNGQLADYIFRAAELGNLDILPSGSIPPNPAELLMNSGIKDLFAALKQQYDYIIVDTAPVGMVTDTLLLNAYADAFVYVVRANYLDKRLLNIAETSYKEKRLSNMAILINGSDHSKGYGYGYGYGGYGYGNEKPAKWWQRK